MSRKILIIDSVATNRIVLRVKMKAAQYDVATCASAAEAGALIVTDPPDLVLINLIDPTEDRFAFLRRLREDDLTANIGVIALGMDDTAKARFAALDAGADDVLPRPISDTLLLARVRNLLRRRNLYQDWHLPDGSAPNFGFEERKARRLSPAAIALISDRSATVAQLVATLQAGLGQSVRHIAPAKAFGTGLQDRFPDLCVIDASDGGRDAQTLMRLVSDLHSGRGPCSTTLLVVVPTGRPDLAAMFLDLGADDVVPATATAEEMGTRCRKLLSFKEKYDTAKERMRTGLEAAITDSLTGLRNRRYAEEHLARIARQSRESGCDYALLMLDIDHFKDINDRFGHPAGDRVLQQMARRLAGCFRKIDLVARIGGEEFLIVMPGTATEQAALAAERLRQAVNAAPFTLDDGSDAVPVTISIGIAVTEGDDIVPATEAEMIARADAALYAAKAAGRDRVQLHLAA